MGEIYQTNIDKCNQIKSKNEYNLLNRDVEICTKYFDVVPDGNLFTLDDVPIFAIRMRPFGIDKIMEIYQKKYNIDVQVLTYKINEKQYMIYSSDSRQIYLTQKEQLLKYFNFDVLKDNEFKGIIIAVSNQDNRLVHAIPYIYGKINGRKKIIFLDPFSSLNCYSGCIIGCSFFQQYFLDIDCYCHGKIIQADHHSCGIIACDFVKKCLQHKAKIAKKILNSVKMKTKLHDTDSNRDFYINIYDLPMELKIFSQLHIKEMQEQSIEDTNSSEEKKQRENWFLKHIRKLIYRRDPEPYDPDGQIVPDSQIEEKEINTTLIEKGHKYADWIIKETKMAINYDSKYWLSIIRKQKIQNPFIKLIKHFTKTLKKKKQN